MNIKNYLNQIITEKSELEKSNLQFPDIDIDCTKIKVLMINETPPPDPEDNFYSLSKKSEYLNSAVSLFNNSGFPVSCMNDITEKGIYITNALKSPKLSSIVEPAFIEKDLSYLEAEIDLFPNLMIIMLMGDVAKKAVNMISKKRTKKNVIPSLATYKIRGNEYYMGNIRVMPSYIMTGANLLIEKSKCDMICGDIKTMLDIIL